MAASGARGHALGLGIGGALDLGGEASLVDPRARKKVAIELRICYGL